MKKIINIAIFNSLLSLNLLAIDKVAQPADPSSYEIKSSKINEMIDGINKVEEISFNISTIPANLVTYNSSYLPTIENIQVEGIRVGNTYTLGIFFNFHSVSHQGYKSVKIEKDLFPFLLSKTVNFGAGSFYTNINDSSSGNNNGGFIQYGDGEFTFGFSGIYITDNDRIAMGTLVIKVDP